MMALTEEWRDVPSYPGFQASSAGRVRRLRDMRMLTLTEHASGYLMVGLYLGKRNTVLRFAHALVCEAFHGPRPSKRHQVAHQDGGRTNNTPSNLAWKTPKENQADRHRHGTMPYERNAWNNKLSTADVVAIKQALKLGSHGIGAKLAKKYGVTEATICGIKHGRSRKYLGPFIPRVQPRTPPLLIIHEQRSDGYESWRSIPSCPNYQASSLGRIRRSVKGQGAATNHVRSPSTNKFGRRSLPLSHDGKITTRMVSSLVCEAFHGQRPSRYHVAAHLNGDCGDDAASNLQWKTVAENVEDRTRHARRKKIAAQSLPGE